jgi:Uma2 family endonuclease
MIVAMDTVLDQPWTADRFLAWEDRQEFKHEFDGRLVIPMTGGSLAHQRIVFNLCVALTRLLVGSPFQVAQEMRLLIGDRVRYPDVVVFSGPLNQTLRTLSDAVAVFEVLSDDTATTDRVNKPIEYAGIHSVRSYILFEQTAVAATMLRREPGGPWITTNVASGDLNLPGLGIALPIAEAYQGLTF